MSSQPEPNESVVLLPVFLTTLSREGEKSQKKPSYIDTPINTHTTQHNMKKDRPVSTNQEPHATVITMGRRVKRTAFPSSHSSTSSNPPHLAAGPSHNLSYLEAIVGVGCVAGDVADAVRSHPGVLALHIAVLVLAFHAALVVGELVVGYCEAKLDLHDYCRGARRWHLRISLPRSQMALRSEAQGRVARTAAEGRT
ncbi:hypothetical protein O3P69_008860 [Scylla paramamosain]|uniref:Uncharacterized protein n=1 Tax=Scylla paramamosain TaxID=85552 RepID=A0AAW0TS13_SCYPA